MCLPSTFVRLQHVTLHVILLHFKSSHFLAITTLTTDYSIQLMLFQLSKTLSNYTDLMSLSNLSNWVGNVESGSLSIIIM